jgi:hypothetical protein
MHAQNVSAAGDAELRRTFERLVAPLPVASFDGDPFAAAWVVPASPESPRITLSRNACTLVVGELDVGKRLLAVHDHRSLAAVHAAQFGDVLPITEHEYERFIGAVKSFALVNHLVVSVSSPSRRRWRHGLLLAIAVAAGLLWALLR